MIKVPKHSPGQHGTYQAIGALRGVSAIMVVAYHAWVAVQERLGGGGPGVLEGVGHGVDIFFVISGFVMVVSSQHLAGRPDGWRVFMGRRLLRIVPMYWLMTTLMIVLTVALPRLVHHAAPDPGNVVASYLFIPSYDGAGEIRPVLADGWTLSFEMMFYTLFALALRLRVSVFMVTVPVFTILAMVAMVRGDDWPAWTSMARELPFEFLFGALIATLALRGRVLGQAMAAMCLAVSAPALILLPFGPIISRAEGVGHVSLRLLTCGVPAAILVASVVALETPARRLLPRWALALGDGSYSIYLSHGFVLAALAAMTIRFGGRHVDGFIVTGIVGATIAGMVLHYMIEAPLQAGLKKWANGMGFSSRSTMASTDGPEITARTGELHERLS